jgi:hypothetical protein
MSCICWNLKDHYQCSQELAIKFCPESVQPHNNYDDNNDDDNNKNL